MSKTTAASRKLTIIAQDPMVKDQKGRILTTQISIPAERLSPGPWGYRVQVIDYDASAKALYEPSDPGPAPNDPFRKAADTRLLRDPAFHAQNVYAIVMRVLARFEFALGRRVSWGFQTHQIKVAPHAFADANAFYSREHEALLFGYFPGRDGSIIYSCLSHDVVAHETTHALVDGLRSCYLDPSSADQAAFHEGISDVVAMLSMFALDDVVKTLLDRHPGDLPKAGTAAFVDVDQLKVENLRKSTLLGLGEEMGDQLNPIRGQPLRQSAALVEPDKKFYQSDPEFREPHRRGEILVAAIMNAFLAVWARRLKSLGDEQSKKLHRDRVAEEGSRAADYLLTMVIRGLDYCPPVHLIFGDYLSAILTADSEIRPNDKTYEFRHELLKSFRAYGIEPASSAKVGEDVGIWEAAEVRCKGELTYSSTRFESLTRDADEVFRFLWENRDALGLVQGVFTHVNSVRPCLRVGPDDGFFLRETVAEYEQQVELLASELIDFHDSTFPKAKGVRKPKDMPDDTPVVLQGGGTLIFDEYGRLKFHINNRLDDVEKQTTRLQVLWDFGEFSRGKTIRRRFSSMHRLRAMDGSAPTVEAWI